TLLSASPRFWTPGNLDWRGRAYSICDFDYQRNDRVRGLFLFDKGLPLGERGLYWLMVHLANHADGVVWRNTKPSKFSFDERVRWVISGLPMFRTIGRSIIDRADIGTWPMLIHDAKKQGYQFLAACVELEKALTVGPENFETRLPISFDGSCSGLQHLCAMTR